MVQSTLSNIVEFTVSELSHDIKHTMENAFGRVRVRGEISGYRGPHSSGHAYFALKDDRARLEAVIWRGAFKGLPAKPEEGMEVIATGKITTYSGASKYQIVIEQLEPAGIGALMALLEERRKNLAAEGLFDEARKRPLPYLPRVIGVVTSPTGAVIRDILHRLSDRFPVRVLVWPVRVQGDTSGPEVARAVRGFNDLDQPGAIPKPDVLIVARGGGSLEDLWGFNDEVVVRAVADSAIPVISAVGHETDWTLIDHVADRRAPTPTGAAEMAVPVRGELVSSVEDLSRRLASAQFRQVERRKDQVRSLARALPCPEDLIGLMRQRFDASADRLTLALARAAERHRAKLERTAARLGPLILSSRVSRSVERLQATVDRLGRAQHVLARDRASRLAASAKLLRSLSYKSVLSRGFAVIRDETGVPVSDIADLSAGKSVVLEVCDGQTRALIQGGPVTEPTVSSKPGKRETARKSAVGKDAATDQGDLF